LYNSEWFVPLTTEEEEKLVVELLERFDEEAQKAGEVDGKVGG